MGDAERTIRWGILGTGRIVGDFARGPAGLPDAELSAAGSRSRAVADAFAGRFDVPRRHANYTAPAAGPDVDVVYVATPHPCSTRGPARRSSARPAWTSGRRWFSARTGDGRRPSRQQSGSPTRTRCPIRPGAGSRSTPPARAR